MYKDKYYGYDIFLIECEKDLVEIYNLSKSGVNVGISIRTSGGNFGTDEIVGMAISVGESYDDYKSYYIPIGHENANNIDKSVVYRLVKSILSECKVVFWDRNYEFSFLERVGIKVPFIGMTYDAQCALYLASSEPRPSLVSYAKSMLGIDVHDYVENETINYSKADPFACFRFIGIKPILSVLLCKLLFEKYPYIKSIYSLDNKSIEAVRRLSKENIYFDKALVHSKLESSKKMIDEKLSEIYSMNGGKFNVNSSIELKEVLCKFVASDKVDIASLEAIDHPFAKLVVEYNKLNKEFYEFLKRLETIESPFHSHYSAVNVPTGRISSGKAYGNDYYAQLNIQSCPKEIRDVFVAPDGWSWMCFDYDSQEMCLMANMSQEDKLLEPIENGKDIHTHIAEKMDFGDIGRDEVKIINFSSNYGASIYSIANKLGKSVDDAKVIMDRYNSVLSSLSSWKDKLVSDARRLGVSFTYFGRPRVLTKYYNSIDYKDMAYADRCAVNSPIQGCVPICSYIELDDKVRTLESMLGERVVCKDRVLLPTRRGSDEPFVVRFGRKDFMVCDINHKFITGSLSRPRYASLKDGKPFRALFSKLHKKKFPNLRLFFEYSSDDMVCYLKLCMKKYNEIGLGDEKLNSAFWKLAFTRTRFDLTHIEMCKIKSLGTLYGFNVCCNKDVDMFHIEFTRKKSGVLRMFKSMLCEKHSDEYDDDVPQKVAVGTCSVISSGDVQMYPSFGVWNKNTGGDILRIDLIKLYERIDSDEEFRNNVKPILTVHDEIDFYVKNGYEEKAKEIICGIMSFKPQGFRTMVKVSCKSGRSWAECK